MHSSHRNDAGLHVVRICAAACALTATWSGSAMSATLKTLYSFCNEQFCPDGLNPANGLLRDPQGNLYGETFEGGAHGVGTVFQLYRPPGKTKYRVRVLYNFCSDFGGCGEDGSGPGLGGHLIIDTQGAIYGAAGAGGSHDGGLVFELTPHNGGKRWSYRALYQFCASANCADGGSPASLTYAGAASGAPYDGVSPLYGLAQYGGANGKGVAFQLTPKARGQWAERVVYGFCAQAGCADGSNPAHDLLLDASGNLFGVTSGGGGHNNAGTVFKLSPTGGARSHETVLHAFCSAKNCADGNGPSGGLVMDAAGNLFGVTALGVNSALECFQGNGCGVLYTVTPDGQQSVLHVFCSEGNCSDGERPSGRLTIDPAGNLLGTTFTGGAHQGGTIFRMSGGAYRVIFDLCSGSCGGAASEPTDGVILDETGALLGTAGGGDANLGVAYRLTP